MTFWRINCTTRYSIVFCMYTWPTELFQLIKWFCLIQYWYYTLDHWSIPRYYRISDELNYPITHDDSTIHFDTIPNLKMTKSYHVRTETEPTQTSKSKFAGLDIRTIGTKRYYDDKIMTTLNQHAVEKIIVHAKQGLIASRATVTWNAWTWL